MWWQGFVVLFVIAVVVGVIANMDQSEKVAKELNATCGRPHLVMT